MTEQELRNHFEQNMLDGDKVQEDQHMLASSYVFEYIVELLALHDRELIKNFCKDKLVIQNFNCGKHGSVDPVPYCPKCLTVQADLYAILANYKKFTIQPPIKPSKSEEEDV